MSTYFTSVSLSFAVLDVCFESMITNYFSFCLLPATCGCFSWTGIIMPCSSICLSFFSASSQTLNFTAFLLFWFGRMCEMQDKRNGWKLLNRIKPNKDFYFHNSLPIHLKENNYIGSVNWRYWYIMHKHSFHNLQKHYGTFSFIKEKKNWGKKTILLSYLDQ